MLPVFLELSEGLFSNDCMLPIITMKSVVYQAVVLGVLLYTVETWPVKQKEVRTLETFHHHHLRILGSCLMNFADFSAY